MRLPAPFAEKMSKMLKNHWQDFQAAWEGPAFLGLRINPLKISREEFLAKAPFHLEPVPWCEDGFYYCQGERPAKHPYYQAGLYYLQEPSAMAPAASLGVRPGDRVLDLCAAPGGKSTQLAGLLKGKGLLVSNDNSAERVKSLVWNLEHWGAVNVVVTNEEPERLVRVFAGYFDKILIDAPCSGEGMFRKDPRAIKNWTIYHSENCRCMQIEILEQGAKMLKPGGRLLYSTCTFDPLENEGVLSTFLKGHKDFFISPLPLGYGWERGRPDWVSEGEAALEGTRRLWPHLIKGEGHFLALLEKMPAEGGKAGEEKEPDKSSFQEGLPAVMEKFTAENLTRTLEGPYLQQGHYLYRVPAGLPDLKGLQVVRPGWFVGVVKNGRFEPSQALAMGLKFDDVVRRVRLTPEEINVEKYLKGETLLQEGTKGWTLVCLEEYPLGWAKQTADYLKNCYPPGWRLMD